MSEKEEPSGAWHQNSELIKSACSVCSVTKEEERASSASHKSQIKISFFFPFLWYFHRNTLYLRYERKSSRPYQSDWETHQIIWNAENSFVHQWRAAPSWLGGLQRGTGPQILLLGVSSSSLVRPFLYPIHFSKFPIKNKGISTFICTFEALLDNNKPEWKTY